MALFSEESRKYSGNLDFFSPNKLEEGEESRIRLLTAEAVDGWVTWPEPGKPIRYRMNDKRGGGKDFKQFYAFIVWNYDINRLQVWEFSQAHVKKSLESLYKNKGCPTSYDLFVSKHGKGTDTRYILRPSTNHKVEKSIEMVFETTPFNLEALYVGKEPFRDLEAGKEVSNDISVA